MLTERYYEPSFRFYSIDQNGSCPMTQKSMIVEPYSGCPITTPSSGELSVNLIERNLSAKPCAPSFAAECDMLVAQRMTSGKCPKAVQESASPAHLNKYQCSSLYGMYETFFPRFFSQVMSGKTGTNCERRRQSQRRKSMYSNWKKNQCRETKQNQLVKSFCVEVANTVRLRPRRISDEKLQNEKSQLQSCLDHKTSFKHKVEKMTRDSAKPKQARKPTLDRQSFPYPTSTTETNVSVSAHGDHPVYSEASTMLLNIKAYVEDIKRARSSPSTSQLEDRHSSNIVLSSSYTDDMSEHSATSSIHSSAATVSGCISLDKAHKCLESKLKQEGYSDSHISYELSCRLSPSQARKQQERHRLLLKRNRINSMKPHTLKNHLPSMRLNTKSKDSRCVSSAESHSRKVEIISSSYNHVSHTRRLNNSQYNATISHCNRSKRTSGKSLGMSTSHPKSINAFKQNQQRRTPKEIDISDCRVSQALTLYDLKKPVPKDSNRALYTIIEKYQKHITKELMHLQKLRDRGEISIAEFETKQQKIVFSKIFYATEEGKVELRGKPSNLQTECFLDDPKLSTFYEMPVPSSKRQRCLYVSEDVVSSDLDFLDDETPLIIRSDMSRRKDKNNFYKSHEASLNQFGHSLEEKRDNASQLDECTDVFDQQQPHLKMNNVLYEHLIKDERRYQRQCKNYQRRIMLMRRFDLRAPPEERMFRRDTSLSSKNCTREQQRTWALWNTLPFWLYDETGHLLFRGQQSSYFLRKCENQ